MIEDPNNLNKLHEKKNRHSNHLQGIRQHPVQLGLNSLCEGQLHAGRVEGGVANVGAPANVVEFDKHAADLVVSDNLKEIEALHGDLLGTDTHPPVEQDVVTACREDLDDLDLVQSRRAEHRSDVGLLALKGDAANLESLGSGSVHRLSYVEACTYWVSGQHVDRVTLLKEAFRKQGLGRHVGRRDVRVVKEGNEVVDDLLGITLLETGVDGAFDIGALRIGALSWSDPVSPVRGSADGGNECHGGSGGEELHLVVGGMSLR